MGSGGWVRPDRLSAMAVLRAVKGAPARAGLDPATVSGHALRVIMKQTRHRSVQVARGYVRDAELWRDNVTAPPAVSRCGLNIIFLISH